MRRFRLNPISVLMLTVFLSGCALLPSKTQMPKAVSDTPADRKSQLQKYDGHLGIYPLAVSRDHLVDQINAYIGEWNKTAERMLIARDVGDNLSFAGIIASGGLLLDNKNSEAKKAAAGVGVLNLISDRYRLSIQASNYSKAASAMVCVRSHVQSVNPEAWDYFYTAKGGLDNVGSLTPVTRGRLATVFSDVNLAMNRIARSLTEAQRAVRITAPSTEEMSKALQTAQRDADAVKDLVQKEKASMDAKGNTLMSVVASQSKLVAASVSEADAAAMIEQLLGLAAKVDVCASTMGS